MTANLDLQLAIDAPPEKVFAAITDLHAGGRWLPGCTKLEVLTPGPHPEAQNGGAPMPNRQAS